MPTTMKAPKTEEFAFDEDGWLTHRPTGYHIDSAGNESFPKDWGDYKEYEVKQMALEIFSRAG